MINKTTLTISTLLLCLNFLFAQPGSLSKFNPVTINDFNPKSEVIDLNANAVTLINAGSSDFEGNSDGNFTLVYKRYTRILIKNKNAFNVASVSVPIFSGKSTTEEIIDDFEATTYNLQSNQIIPTKLNKTDLLKEKSQSGVLVYKFSFPNVKEGSIIEYKYTIKSPYYRNLRSWKFQNQYPCLQSEYRVIIPHVFKFLFIKKGYIPFAVDSVNKIFRHYTVINTDKYVFAKPVYTDISGEALFHLWIAKDVPAFKQEKYISAIQNHLSQVSFKLHSIHYSENDKYYLIKNWDEVSNSLLKDDYFYKDVMQSSDWLNDELNKVKTMNSPYDKAKYLYNYIQSNFTCTDYHALFLSQPLKKTYQIKSGNVVDINLLLAKCLYQLGFEVNAVILSTKENGLPNETMPILDQYDYVILNLKIDSTSYYLDASVPRIGFGKLPDYCYNQYGRLIDDNPKLIDLSPNNLEEKKNALIVIVNDSSGMSGNVVNNMGYYESFETRNDIVKNGKTQFNKDLENKFKTLNAEVENISLDSLNIYELPITLLYDVKLKPFEEDIIYFNPMILLSWSKNPFVSAKRMYPVEMDYKINEVFTLDMEIPKGYMVDEIPKSNRVTLNEEDGMFEYIIRKDENKVQLRSKLILKKAIFDYSDYDTLRDFFGFVVKKHAEQIVFKKIK